MKVSVEVVDFGDITLRPDVGDSIYLSLVDDQDNSRVEWELSPSEVTELIKALQLMQGLG